MRRSEEGVAPPTSLQFNVGYFPSGVRGPAAPPAPRGVQSAPGWPARVLLFRPGTQNFSFLFFGKFELRAACIYNQSQLGFFAGGFDGEPGAP